MRVGTESVLMSCRIGFFSTRFRLLRGTMLVFMIGLILRFSYIHRMPIYKVVKLFAAYDVKSVIVYYYPLIGHFNDDGVNLATGHLLLKGVDYRLFKGLPYLPGEYES